MGFSLYETILWHINHRNTGPDAIIDELLHNGCFGTVYELRNVDYFRFCYDLYIIADLIELKNLEQVQIYIEKFKPDKDDCWSILNLIDDFIDPDTAESQRESLDFIKRYYDII